MKRKVVCFFSLLLLLFVFFSLVNPKVEDEMITLAEAKNGEAKKRRRLVIGKISTDWPHSDDRLFIIVDGEGWEEGPRISEIPSSYFDDGGGYIELGEGTAYRYIFSASREPVSGDPVRVVETHRGADTYLIWNPEPFGEIYNLTNVMTVDAVTDNAVLISTRGASFPFFEHNIWFRFRESVGPEVRVYSLHDIGQFTDALPWIAGVAAALLGCLILWGGGWRLSGKRGGKWVWFVNVPLIAALLAALPYLLRQFDLPASLMPPSSILDLSHYRETFSRITAAMDALGVAAVGERLARAGAWCAAILGAGVLFACGVTAAEAWLCRRRAKTASEESAR